MSDILRLSVPLTVWLASFSAIYGLGGVLCSTGMQSGLLDGRATLTFAWLFAIAIQIALLFALRSARLTSASLFVRKVSVSLAVASLFATIWTLFPVLTASQCL